MTRGVRLKEEENALHAGSAAYLAFQFTSVQSLPRPPVSPPPLHPKDAPPPAEADAQGLQRAPSLAALLSESDVLSLHCQPPEDVPHLLRETELRMCKRGGHPLPSRMRPSLRPRCRVLSRFRRLWRRAACLPQASTAHPPYKMSVLLSSSRHCRGCGCQHLQRRSRRTCRSEARAAGRGARGSGARRARGYADRSTGFFPSFPCTPQMRRPAIHSSWILIRCCASQLSTGNAGAVPPFAQGSRGSSRGCGMCPISSSHREPRSTRTRRSKSSATQPCRW